MFVKNLHGRYFTNFKLIYYKICKGFKSTEDEHNVNSNYSRGFNAEESLTKYTAI